uniref:7TM_GPCR_Srx domain-containing protein n=1 Tax=Heterorhabditis bacteriophora TaxID=37862 RepID=A0A1I7WVY2_HETBA
MTARSSVYAYAMGAGAAGAIGAAFFFFIAFLLANILMWWAYTKSLSLSDSTTESMVLNLGTNFVLTVGAGLLIMTYSFTMFSVCDYHYRNYRAFLLICYSRKYIHCYGTLGSFSGSPCFNTSAREDPPAVIFIPGKGTARWWRGRTTMERILIPALLLFILLSIVLLAVILNIDRRRGIISFYFNMKAIYFYLQHGVFITCLIRSNSDTNKRMIYTVKHISFCFQLPLIYH